MKKILLLLAVITNFGFTTNHLVMEEKVLNYIERFAKVAVQEEKIHGIPAYLTLAQGIHESDCATSELYKKSKNHFGIKDGYLAIGYVKHKDGKGYAEFAKYESDWASFRSHSVFLNKPNYERLHKVNKKNYKEVCRVVKLCGYAVDPKYPEKLIRYIEEYNLTKF